MARILGIDLAAQPDRTAACVLGEAPTVGWDDEALLAEMRRADAIGIDAPFGWPADFVRQVAAHATSGVWTADPQSRSLRLRATDLAVHAQTGLWPLSVSSDRIAVCAWRCVSLLHRLGARRDRAFETYPAAALHAWGLPARGYKRPEAAPARARIVAALGVAQADLVDGRGADHRLDALICALVAREALEGRTLGPRGARESRLAASEGWIHVPAPGAPPAVPDAAGPAQPPI
jgi:predicted nuclease with RNAse H fold